MKLEPNNAYLIAEEDEITRVNPKNGTDFKLEEIQKHVDGYIEVIRLSDVWIMIVNEEGKFSKGYNSIATALAHLHHAIGSEDFIAGDAVICPSTMLL